MRHGVKYLQSGSEPVLIPIFSFTGRNPLGQGTIYTRPATYLHACTGLHAQAPNGQSEMSEAQRDDADRAARRGFYSTNNHADDGAIVTAWGDEFVWDDINAADRPAAMRRSPPRHSYDGTVTRAVENVSTRVVFLSLFRLLSSRPF
jgi:hypothetical protein